MFVNPLGLPKSSRTKYGLGVMGKSLYYIPALF